jgi:HK97 family phage portal protein
MRLFKRHTEDRSLSPPEVQPTWQYLSSDQPLDVNQSNWARVSDAWACVQLISSTIGTLPLHAFRRTAQGRVPAGDDARIVRLLARPSPGSTVCDLVSSILVSLLTTGDAFVALYRSGSEVVQLGLLDPCQVEVELRGQTIVYTLSLRTGQVEVGPTDVLHVKGMPGIDGLRGLSPIQAARTALGLSSGLQASAKAFIDSGSRPSGILTVPAVNRDQTELAAESWSMQHGGARNQHRVAVVAGDVQFTALGMSNQDAEFVAQRELSTREICRVFNVPGWAVGAEVPGSLTYSNTLEQARALHAYTLRPWLVRLETAITNHPDLCPGGTFVKFNLDGLLRADAATRSEIYTRALSAETGWMSRDEVRALEELEPEGEETSE